MTDTFDDFATPGDAAEPAPRSRGKGTRSSRTAAKAATAPRGPGGRGRGARLKRTSKQDVADSVRSLAMMLSVQAGELVPLTTLADQYAGTRLGAAYQQVADDVAAGTPFATALARQEVFPPVVTRLVGVGARAGDTVPYLTKAADLLDEGLETTGKVKSALLEPALLGVGVAVFFVAMVTWAVPQMVDVFAQTGAQLPALTVLAMQVSKVAQLVVPLLAVAALSAWVWWRKVGRRNAAARAAADGFVLKVPVIGRLKRDAALANSLAVLAALTELGIGERDALLTAADGCDNQALARHLRRHADKVVAGASTFADLSDGILVPLPVGAVLSAAGNAGRLPVGLAHVAAVYRQTARRKADNLSTALSPVANIVVGALFAGAVIVVYVPMYSLFSAMTAMAF